MAESKTPLTDSPSAAHTPTPWELTERNYIRAPCYKSEKGFPAICHVDPWPSDRWTFLHEAESRANAEFIVRAVNSHQDLLDALKELVKCCPFTPTSTGVKVYVTLAQIAKAQAAIKKAEANEL